MLLSPGWLEACATAYADPAAGGPVGLAAARRPRRAAAAADPGRNDELLAPDAERLAASASAAGVDVTYTRWPGMWHDFALQPGLLAAADSALAQAAWFVTTVTSGLAAVVLASLYPGVTVLLARVVLGERLRWLQRLGLGLAAIGILLVAA